MRALWFAEGPFSKTWPNRLLKMGCTPNGLKASWEVSLSPPLWGPMRLPRVPWYGATSPSLFGAVLIRSGCWDAAMQRLFRSPSGPIHWKEVAALTLRFFLVEGLKRRCDAAIASRTRRRERSSFISKGSWLNVIENGGMINAPRT